MPEKTQELTRLLAAWSHGDESAIGQLAPLVYSELHRLASAQMAQERPSHTLQPTALLHEAFLRLLNGSPPEWDSRGHFYAFAAKVMRQVLVDHARRHQAGKRAGQEIPPGIPPGIQMDELVLPEPRRPVDVLDLHLALEALEEFDQRKARILELHYFAGLEVEESGRALGISERTARRELRLAEAWLHRKMSGGRAS